MDEFPGPDGWASDPDDDEENPEPKLSRMCVQIPGLRARTKTLITSPFDVDKKEEAEILTEAASKIDYELSIWAATLPPLFGYKSVAIPRPVPDDLATAEMWPGPVHVYEDLITAALMNHYRLSRISCQDVVMECAEWLAQEHDGPSTNRHLDYGRVIVQQMIDEICASVPFHLGYDLQHHAQQKGQDSMG